ncbi:MAG: MOSC domain-containing protein [Cytophagales bacterium CG12_big_fil_rev_8_21_14_0_65_40_12]|nr:MAG: MOSC domain-containing protein [Cytophagales bacterium CG12_big_fil_rev_8_21_14_0_65_40_12]PIW03994.1 MAG: MOSC domain-containing protein [Cytophagales bacterium CG17_big_fil_post_rev_8_21_14_2_50_40_13]
MLPIEQKSIAYLTSQFSQNGTVELVTIRPKRGELPVIVQEVEAIVDRGLDGDHYASKGGKRQVTLIQAEHIAAVSSMLGREMIDPLSLRRNVVVHGINLQSLKGKQFKLGEAILEHTGDCHPCSRTEENLGEGGYNAMRGHGGITAKVISSGVIRNGDSLEPIS